MNEKIGASTAARACMGCSLNEDHYLIHHSKSKDIIKANNQEVSKSLSRVNLEVNHYLTFAIQYQHYNDPLCITAGLSDAMQKDEEIRIVTYDAICIGYWTEQPRRTMMAEVLTY